jgi:hypothetical protein
MDVGLVVLRLIHILTGVIWFGIGSAITLLLLPAVIRAGDSGFRYLRSLTSLPLYRFIMPATAVTTTLAGILLYLVGDSISRFSDLGNAVLGIGAAAGLLAAGHGGTATDQASKRLHEALKRDLPDENSAVPAESRPELDLLLSKFNLHSRISFTLTLIALMGMASARYL